MKIGDAADYCLGAGVIIGLDALATISAYEVYSGHPVASVGLFGFSTMSGFLKYGGLVAIYPQIEADIESHE